MKIVARFIAVIICLLNFSVFGWTQSDNDFKYCLKSSDFLYKEDSVALIMERWETVGRNYFMEKRLAYHDSGHVELYDIHYNSIGTNTLLSIEYENLSTRTYDSIYPRKIKEVRSDTILAQNIRSRNEPDPYYICSNCYHSLSIEWQHLDTTTGLYFLLEIGLNTGDDTSVLYVINTANKEEYTVAVDPQYGQTIYEWMLLDMREVDSLALPPIRVSDFDLLDSNMVLTGMVISKSDYQANFSYRLNEETDPLKTFRKSGRLIEKRKRYRYYELLDIYDERLMTRWELFYWK